MLCQSTVNHVCPCAEEVQQHNKLNGATSVFTCEDGNKYRKSQVGKTTAGRSSVQTVKPLCISLTPLISFPFNTYTINPCHFLFAKEVTSLSHRKLDGFSSLNLINICICLFTVLID